MSDSEIFYCDTCNAGPWRHGTIGTAGTSIDHIHAGHKIRKA